MMCINENANGSISRVDELKAKISDYENIKGEIKTGIELEAVINERKRVILKYLNSDEMHWNDYRWQLKNSFINIEMISKVLNLSPIQAEEIKKVGETFRFAVSPYYLSLIDPDRPHCPIWMQTIPSVEEMSEKGEYDPMNEEGTTLAKILIRRYPDRVAINVTNKCGSFCRHCQRRRLIGDKDKAASKIQITNALEYIRDNKEIRDVLITGGDAFLLSDFQIDWILRELRSIQHVEIIRFGTRTPVTLPQRITKNLGKILKRYNPVYVNTQFNHPLEITAESKEACDRLTDAGILLGNQMVLLKNINNDKYIVRKLNQELLRIRVRPYYIFHPKQVKGTSHFWVSIQEGLEIMDNLRGFTSGLAVPYYVVNAPKGLGKTPILPQYLLSLNEDEAVFRNWENKIFTI